jgi:sugar lactone lactonase YvrE
MAGSAERFGRKGHSAPAFSKKQTLIVETIYHVMKSKMYIPYSLRGAAWAGAVLLTACGAQAQNLFVSGGDGDIYEYTPGGVQSTFATLSGACALAFDSAGDLFVGNNPNGNIYEYKAGYVTGQTPLTFATGLPGVTGLAFNSAGDLFVAIGSDGSNIYEYTPGGVQSIFATGLPNVEGLAFNSAGNLFAAGSSSTDTITEITPGGVKTPLGITGLNEPGMLAFNSAGDLFIANNYGGNIIEYTPGGVQSTFASGTGTPYGIAFNKSGVLFEGDANASTINEFTPSGAESSFFSTSGEGGLGWMTVQGGPLPVPEPSALESFGAASAALLMLRRKYFSR